MLGNRADSFSVGESIAVSRTVSDSVRDCALEAEGASSAGALVMSRSGRGAISRCSGARCEPSEEVTVSLQPRCVAREPDVM